MDTTGTLPTHIGPYEIRGMLGRGGMGVVYRGVSTAGEQVAVKRLLPDVVANEQERRRFAHEVGALRTVFGPRVVSYIEADTDVEQPWLAVEYVPGPTLRAHIEEHGPLPANLVAILGAALAEGLRSIHKGGLLHRDLKPHNIILASDGPKVIDFGLAVLTQAKVDAAGGRIERLTEPGGVVGTLVCMPAEQVEGRELSEASDVYALGATLLYAATGHYPFDGATPYLIMRAIADSGTDPDLTGLDERLRPTVSAMLAHDADERPSLETTAAELAAVATAAGSTATAARRALVRATAVPHPPAEERPGASSDTQQTQPSRRIPGDGNAAPEAARTEAERLRTAYATGATL